MPSPSPAPHQAQISVTFNQSDHALVVSFSRIKQVLYTIRYEVPLTEGATASGSAEVAERPSAIQGITNRGQADLQGRFSATHVLGTASGEDVIQHQVKEGFLQATIITANNQRERLSKRFVIEDSGKVVLFDQVASVSATSATKSAVLGATTSPLPTVAPSTTMATETTATPPGSKLGAISDISLSVWFIGGGVLLMVGVAVYAWWQHRQATSATASAN